jgi:hypothetical protein
MTNCKKTGNSEEPIAGEPGIFLFLSCTILAVSNIMI